MVCANINSSAVSGSLIVPERCPTPEMEVSTFSSSKKEEEQVQANRTTKKRKLRFNRRVYVLETIHVNDMTDHEIEEAWYKREDFVQMKKEFAVTVKLMMKNLPIPEDQTSRGLEYRHPKGSKARQLNKFYGLASVLEEQERQVQLDMEDDEALSQVYQRVSARCQKAAHLMALRDQADVGGDHQLSPSFPATKEQVMKKRVTRTASPLRRLFPKQA